MGRLAALKAVLSTCTGLPRHVHAKPQAHQARPRAQAVRRRQSCRDAGITHHARHASAVRSPCNNENRPGVEPMTLTTEQPVHLMPRTGAKCADERWPVEAIEALFDLPFAELLHRAQGVHREHHDPREIELATLLSV